MPAQTVYLAGKIRPMAWRRDLLADEIQAVLRSGPTNEEINAVAERLLGLAA